MKPYTYGQRNLIFKLAGDRGITNEVLHDHVYTLTGKDSITKLSASEAIKVIDSLKDEKSNAEGMMTYRQKKYLTGLAREVGWTDSMGKLDSKRLNRWLSKYYGVDSIEWLDAKKASYAIEGLKDIKDRLKSS